MTWKTTSQAPPLQLEPLPKALHTRFIHLSTSHASTRQQRQRLKSSLALSCALHGRLRRRSDPPLLPCILQSTDPMLCHGPPPLTLGSAPNNNPAQWDAFAGLTKPPAVMPPKGAAKAPAKAPARKRTTSQAAPAPAAVAFPPGITTRAQKAAFVATSGSAPAVPAAPPSAPPVTTAPPTSQAPAGIDLDAYSGALDADMAAQFANLSDASLVSAGPDSSVSLSSASASASSSSSAGLFQNATL